MKGIERAATAPAAGRWPDASVVRSDHQLGRADHLQSAANTR
jgi:hypothetical protein